MNQNEKEREIQIAKVEFTNKTDSVKEKEENKMKEKRKLEKK